MAISKTIGRWVHAAALTGAVAVSGGGGAMLSSAVAFMAAPPAYAQGVPVVDTQNIAQEIRQIQQMLEDYGIQSDQLDRLLVMGDNQVVRRRQASWPVVPAGGRA